MIVLNFSRSLLILGNIDSAQCAHVDAGARMEHVGQHQAHQNRDSGHDFEIQNGLETDTPQLLGIAHACNADDQRGDNDRDNDHLDQTNEDIACGLQDVSDPPGLFCTEMIEQRPHSDTQYQSDQNLPGQTQLCLLHIITLVQSGLGKSKTRAPSVLFHSSFEAGAPFGNVPRRSPQTSIPAL